MSPSRPLPTDSSSSTGTPTAGRAELDYLRTGRSNALDRFSKEYAVRILTWAIRLGPPDIDPQRVTREVFSEVLGQLDNQPEKLPAKVWIYRISRKAILRNISQIAKDKRNWFPWKKAKKSTPPPSIDEQSNPRRRAIQIILQKLDLREREALVLVDMEDFSLAEAGLLIGVKAPEVGVYLQKARSKFARDAAIESLGPPQRRASPRRTKR